MNAHRYNSVGKCTPLILLVIRHLQILLSYRITQNVRLPSKPTDRDLWWNNTTNNTRNALCHLAPCG